MNFSLVHISPIWPKLYVKIKSNTQNAKVYIGGPSPEVKRGWGVTLITHPI
jgi:hypothetical protein